MTSPSLSDRDYELISAYLDGEVDIRQKKAIETRLAQDAQFKSAYEQLSRTRRLVRSQPLLRAPRNYTLSPKMLSASQASPKAFVPFPLLLRTASAFASLIFVLLFGLNWIVASRMMNAAPMASSEVLSQPAQPALVEEQAVQSTGASGEEQPLAKSMATSVPEPKSLVPPAGEFGGMGEGGGAGAVGGEEAPLLEPDSGTALIAPTATLSATLPLAPFEITGEVDIQSEPGVSETPMPETPDLTEVSETEGLIRGWRQNWLMQQILFGVLAVSFAIIAIRVGKRKD